MGIGERINSVPSFESSMQEVTMPRAKTLERQRLEALAEEQGISYETLRKQVQREAKAEGRLPPVPELWGISVPEEAVREMREGQQSFDRIASHLRQVIGLLNQVPSSVVPADRRRLLVDTIREAAQLVRGNRPACLCPYCKGLPGVVETCIASVGTRWLAAKQEEAVLLKFKDTENPIVLLNDGSCVPVSDLPKPPEPTQTESAPEGQPEAEDTIPLDVEYEDGEGPLAAKLALEADDAMVAGVPLRVFVAENDDVVESDPWGLD